MFCYPICVIYILGDLVHINFSHLYGQFDIRHSNVMVTSNVALFVRCWSSLFLLGLSAPISLILLKLDIYIHDFVLS